MSVDRITDQEITSSSPTSSLFLNSNTGKRLVIDGALFSGCQKSPLGDFFDSLHPVPFPPSPGRKSPRCARRSPCRARTAGDVIPFEAGLSIPAPLVSGIEKRPVDDGAPACRKTSVRRQTCYGGAGELEGAAARLEWDDIPRSPCRARAAASKARTFPPWRGRESNGMQAVEKVPQGTFSTA